MLNRRKSSCRQWSSFFRNGNSILFMGLLLLVSQAACSKKNIIPGVPAGPIQVALLPFETPAENKDLRWTAMAGPILMAKASEKAPDLVVIPLWQTMTTAIASAGASRSFDQTAAAATTDWLGAKWSILGYIKPDKSRASLMIDFIPGGSNQIAFRYMKKISMDLFEQAFFDATRQFVRYLSANPPEPMKIDGMNINLVKDLAKALDREYGWFEDADPGKSQDIVAELARLDEHLARLLFNPALYPILAKNE
jgi:hypothetical protein